MSIEDSASKTQKKYIHIQFQYNFNRVVKHTYKITPFQTNKVHINYSNALSISTNPQIKTGEIILFCNKYLHFLYYDYFLA